MQHYNAIAGALHTWRQILNWLAGDENLPQWVVEEELMNGTSEESHGIILSGGGANGAYEIGVLKALFAGKAPVPPGDQRLEPDVFAGTSVGSYNAAFLVSRWGTYGSAAIASLEQLWLDTVSSSTDKPDNSVFRIREDPRTVHRPQKLYPKPDRALL